MLRKRSSVSKKGIYLGLTVIIIMALGSYYYTGSFTQGMKPIVKEGIVEPVQEKIELFLDNTMTEINMSQSSNQ